MDTKEKQLTLAEVNRVIDDLGGTFEAASLCDTSESAVSQWRRNGIPDARLMYLRAVRPEVFKPAKRSRRSAAPP